MGIEQLYRESRRAAVFGIFVGVGLGVAKLFGGWYGHSIALLSDSVQSLGDALVCLVVWVALRWAQVPPDREHPYGHTRGEAVAGSNVALLLMVSAVGILWEAIHTMGQPAPAPENFAVWIAGASVVVKEALYRYSAAVARRTGSSAIQATALDHRLDALSSLAVVAGLILAKWGGPAYHAADHLAAVFVGLAVLWMGGQVYWRSLQELMDRQADPAILTEIRSAAGQVPGVRDVEKLRVRKTGLEYLVDIHIEVDPELTVRESHAIAHAVKDRLISQFIPVKDVLVHVEPSLSKREPRRQPADGASTIPER